MNLHFVSNLHLQGASNNQHIASTLCCESLKKMEWWMKANKILAIDCI